MLSWFGCKCGGDRREDVAPLPGLGLAEQADGGYQGVSGRFSSQRQSGDVASRIHTGLPIAAARWPTDVSAVTTRSRHSSSAMVSL